MIKGKKIAVCGCKSTTLSLLDGLSESRIVPDLVVTISPEKGESQKVAGYENLVPHLQQRGIDYYVADKYSLQSETDKKWLIDQKIDLIFVMGWQRLLPDWLLSTLSIGAYGMHGSNKPLPHGRGRSPLNWSLIQGKNIFFTHLFRYKPGVDDGDIAGVQTFEINDFDTCNTLHYKNLLSMVGLVKKSIHGLIDGSIQHREQDEEGVSFYPKRTAEDGLIDWNLSTTELYNFVRALTRPFPGAFSFAGQSQVFIWKAQPFDFHLQFPDYKPGQVVFTFPSGDFIVKTGDGTLLVTEYEGIQDTDNLKNTQLHNNGLRIKKWDNLPR